MSNINIILFVAEGQKPNTYTWRHSCLDLRAQQLAIRRRIGWQSVLCFHGGRRGGRALEARPSHPAHRTALVSLGCPSVRFGYY